MNEAIAAISVGLIAGIIYYIIKNYPPGGGFRGGFA